MHVPLLYRDSFSILCLSVIFFHRQLALDVFPHHLSLCFTGFPIAVPSLSASLLLSLRT